MPFTYGTLFHNRRLPLQTLFAIVWLLTVDSRNLNTAGIVKLLGLKSYRLTWQWIQKVRTMLLYAPECYYPDEVEIDAFKFSVKHKNNVGKTETKEARIMAIVNRDASFGELLKLVDITAMRNPDRNIHIREVISTISRIYAPDRTWFYGDERQYYYPMSVARKNFRYSQYCKLPLPAMVAEAWHEWARKHYKNNFQSDQLQGYLNTFIYYYNRPATINSIRYFSKALSALLNSQRKCTHQGRHH